jgi:hypothetical protein
VNARGPEPSSANFHWDLEDPEDLAHREHLRRVLISARKAGDGLTEAEVSEMLERGPRYIEEMERHSRSYFWKLPSILKWGRAVHIDLIMQTPGIPELEVTQRDFESFRKSAGVDWDTAYTRNRLLSVQRERAIHNDEMARRLGINVGSLNRIYRSTEPRMSTLQRFARALGGELYWKVMLYRGDL